MDKKKIEIVVPILNDEYKVIVVWGDLKYIQRVSKSWHHDTLSEQALDLESRRGLCLYKNDAHPIIVLPRRPKTAEEIGTLSHEAVHAINNIFDKIQAFKDDELFAHSVGAVVRKVLASQKGK